MFRCVTQLKGLIIDIDSFGQFSPSEWLSLTNNYTCLFLSSKDETIEIIERLYGSESIYKIEPFIMLFAPGKTTHSKALQHLRMQTSEVAYVSTSHRFICNAQKFLSGTIWIYSSTPTYKEASSCPDLICDTVSGIDTALAHEAYGLFGEVVIRPLPVSKKSGFILAINWEEETTEIPLFSAGRYFGYDHYMSQLHPYSSAIYLNKQFGKKAYGSFNSIFAGIYSTIIKSLSKTTEINCICHVPTRPGRDDRFKPISTLIASRNDLEDISNKFICLKDYPTQKNLSAHDRYNNVKDVFKYNSLLNEKTVVLIDDIMTTGSTIRACVEQLKKQGADNVLVVVLAINQIDGSYWSATQPFIHCPTCDARMHLLANSNTHSFFYSCFERCLPDKKWQSLPYDKALEQLVECVDSEFLRTKAPENETNI